MDRDEQFGSLDTAFARYRGKALLVSFDTDWLFPPDEVARLHAGMRRAGVDATHLAIASSNGHDAFLVDYPLIVPPVRAFLEDL
jgi:homoserine O-acetyltransferase/O-succinyltransferase